MVIAGVMLMNGCAAIGTNFHGRAILLTPFPGEGYRGVVVRDEAGEEQWLSRDAKVYYVDPMMPNAEGKLGRLVGTQVSTLLDACTRSAQCYLRSPGAMIATIAPGADIEPKFDATGPVTVPLFKTLAIFLAAAAVVLNPASLAPLWDPRSTR